MAKFGEAVSTPGDRQAGNGEQAREYSARLLDLALSETGYRYPAKKANEENADRMLDRAAAAQA